MHSEGLVSEDVYLNIIPENLFFQKVHRTSLWQKFSDITKERPHQVAAGRIESCLFLVNEWKF